MKKTMKALLTIGGVWLWGALIAGGTLSRTWAKLKLENEDRAADVLDKFAKKTYCKPVVGIFEVTKTSVMKIFEDD